MLATDVAKNAGVWATAQPFLQAAFPYVLLVLGWLARGQWRLDRDPRKQIAIDLEIAKSLPESPTRTDLAAQVDRRVRAHYTLDAPTTLISEGAVPVNILSARETRSLFRATDRFADWVAVTFGTLILALLFTRAAFKAQPHGFDQWFIGIAAFAAPLIIAAAVLFLLAWGLRRRVRHTT